MKKHFWSQKHPREYIRYDDSLFFLFLKYLSGTLGNILEHAGSVLKCIQAWLLNSD